MISFTLEELQQIVEVFSPHQCGMFADCCIVALEKHNHASGCLLTISGELPIIASLNWSTQVKKAGYKEQKKYIEHGAEAIAFFLSTSLTEFDVVEEAPIGSGFDYWLGYNDGHIKYNPKNFMQARLEVSGINQEAPSNSVNTRVKGKKKQTDPTDFTNLPAYVAVVEFSTPKAYFGKK